uniref:Bridging integrator 3 n=1 Tax=Chrysolophus pictus TaxID=9089 RepID=A0A8C3M0Q6_CHRPC
MGLWGTDVGLGTQIWGCEAQMWGCGAVAVHVPQCPQPGVPLLCCGVTDSIPSPPFPPQAREELRPVKEDFEAKNKQLLEEMPKFYSSRIDYFKPSFEALLRAQVVFYSEMRTIFGDLTAQIGRPALSDEQRERENEGRLGELRALSIVADD